jgi:DNA processing protein
MGCVVSREFHPEGLRPVTTLDPDHPHWPPTFWGDDDAPARLEARGDTAVLGRGPRVGIVGTRRCTRYGHDLALEFGIALSEAGIVVVSGLARGIDAAAHQGALRGPTPPIGVVGTGLDHPYPRSNLALWGQVAAAGVLISEADRDAGPAPWVFPRRNRVIAALSEVLIVVESHIGGGSLITAREADRRSRQVMAVPGSVRSPASVGTNQLIRDGCTPLLDIEDVLAAVGFAREHTHFGTDAAGDVSDEAADQVPGASSPRSALLVGPAPSPGARAILDALGWEPGSFDQLALRTGLDLAQLARGLDELVETGQVAEERGWFERRGHADG